MDVYWIGLAIFTLLIISVLYYVLVVRRYPPLENARRLHHSEPPMAQSAIREYHRAAQQGNPNAMYPVATIYDHGVYQGSQPVRPNRAMAIGYYRQVAVLGSATERALARDRLDELGDRVFVNPPPRALAVQSPPSPPPDPQLPRSDSQNVHDSSVVRSIKAILSKIPYSPLSTEDTLKQVRTSLGQNEDAIKGLDLMERNFHPLSALNMTEVDALRKVWGRIHTEPDPGQKENMKEMLGKRLQECGEETSCASGRVARVVDSLSTFDDHVHLRPLWALRQEMMAKASVMQTQRLPDTDSGSFKDALKRKFHQDYVQTGLMTSNVLESELEQWGDV